MTTCFKSTAHGLFSSDFQPTRTTTAWCDESMLNTCVCCTYSRDLWSGNEGQQSNGCTLTKCLILNHGLLLLFASWLMLHDKDSSFVLKIMYRKSLFRCKNIFMCRKNMKIMFTNIITCIQCKIFEQILKTSTLAQNYFSWKFLAQKVTRQKQSEFRLCRTEILWKNLLQKNKNMNKS